MMLNRKPVFVVEGDLEKEFLQKQCGTKSIIRRIPSNGDDVAVERLAAMIAAIVRALHNPERIFVILDREHREETSEQLEILLLNQLKALGLGGNLSVHIPDRMIENWILADPGVLKSENLEINLQGGSEGCGGKAKLKEAFRMRKDTYSERIDGVYLLSKCTPTTLLENSPSFARLYPELKKAVSKCPWLAAAH